MSKISKSKIGKTSSPQINLLYYQNHYDVIEHNDDI
jgi:hypothetical protein